MSGVSQPADHIAAPGKMVVARLRDQLSAEAKDWRHNAYTRVMLAKMHDQLSTTPSQGLDAATAERCAQDRADWLLDAIAVATQDRRFLRGDPAYDEVAGEAILLNGAKAIRVAIERTLATDPHQHGAGNGEKHGG